MMKLTKPQMQSLHKKWQRNNQEMSYLQFRRTVFPEIGSWNCAMVWWNGMLVGIETDGHAHT